MPIQDEEKTEAAAAADGKFVLPKGYTATPEGNNISLHEEIERRANEVLAVLKGADDNVKLSVLALLAVEVAVFRNGMDIGSVVGGIANDVVAMLQLRAEEAS